MGRKGSWFSAVKKALSAESKEKKDQKTQKPKKKWFGKHKDADVVSSTEETAFVITAPHPPSPPPPPPPPPLPLPLLPPAAPKKDVKLVEAESEQSKHVKLTEAESEQSKHVYSVALATAMAAEAAVAAAQAAAEVVRLTTVPRYPGKSEEEVAAIRIQTAFRGHLSRRALRALRGLVRLKSLIQGQSVKRQATTTLRCMQTLARVQSQIRERRIRMSEENQALQRQLQQKQERELENARASVASMGEEWNDSTRSKEQVEAKLQMKQEAAMRRERALAYAYSHQQMWKNSSKSAHPTFMDASNPHWGWSWLERWMAARPWESRSTADYNDRVSMKSAASRASMSVGEITKAYTLRDANQDNRPSPSTQKSSRPPSRQSPSTMGRTPKRNGWGGDEDSRSTYSIQSERYHRRHSIAGSSVRDDESLASSPSVPSYMTPTKSARARSRLGSPSSTGLEKNETPEKGSVSSVKKRLSFPASPAGPRRHSGPARIDHSSTKGAAAHMEEKVSKGGGSR